jgi:hypothetical protein
MAFNHALPERVRAPGDRETFIRERPGMAAKTEHFQVGCGDMTLITLDSGKTLQIDCNIRMAADDPKDKTADVASQLKDRVKTDADGRPYVDVVPPGRGSYPRLRQALPRRSAD